MPTEQERATQILKDWDERFPPDKLSDLAKETREVYHGFHNRLTQLERKPKMVKFTDTKGDDFYINPLYVRTIFIARSEEIGDRTILVTGEDAWHYAACSVEQALEAIEAA